MGGGGGGGEPGYVSPPRAFVSSLHVCARVSSGLHITVYV